MKVIALVNLYKYVGWHGEKVNTFTKGKKYNYYPLDSAYNQKLVEPNKGPRVPFTDEEFNKYFRVTANCN